MGNLSRAERNIRWIEQHCRIPEGRDVMKPVKLREWQRDIIRGIYDTPTRRAIISFGRKNAKTTLSAFLCLLHLCGPEARANSQLYSAAQSREQAAILFNLAAKMVRMSPDLTAFVRVLDSGKELLCEELGTRYKALSAEASTAYGLSPVFVVHDELGQVHGPRSELFEALETASAAHENPLSLVISTQAPTDADLLSELIERTEQTDDPRFKLFLYTADVEADPFEEATIRQANPAFGDFQNADEILSLAREAKASPPREASYRNLILNQRVDANEAFIAPSIWRANAGQPDLDFTGCDVWGGLDLSQKTDFSALVWLGDRGGSMDVAANFWLPSAGLHEKARTDHAPYDLYREQGYLTTSPGETVDYMQIAEEIIRARDQWRLRKIGYDPYLSQALWPLLEHLGMGEEERAELFVKFPQTYTGMSSAICELEAALYERRLRHGQHPVLSLHAVNAVAHRGPVTDQVLIKKPPNARNKRIDGLVALAMAVGVRAAHVEELTGPSFWETMEAAE